MPGFALDQLKLAFAYHFVRELVGADGDLHELEKRWLSRTFPQSTLSSSGFVGADGAFTSEFDAAFLEALQALPERLDERAKLELLETLLEASLADDELHHTEGNVLLGAAEALGVPPQVLDAHLDTLDSVGGVDLDEPVDD